MEKIVIPYFNIYASDFKAFKDKLTSDEIIETIDAISDICLFGDSDFNTENKFQMMFFLKLKENLLKNIPKYKSCIENGKKGGRPKKNNPNNNPNETQEKPIGFISENPNETQTKPIKEKKIKENIIEDNNNKIKKSNDIFCNVDFQKCFNLYEKICNNLIPIGFAKRNKDTLNLLSDFLEETEYDFEYFERLCNKSNELKTIVNTKIDFKMMLKNHEGIMNDKYIKHYKEADLSEFDFG